MFERIKWVKKTNCNNSVKCDHGVEQKHHIVNNPKPMKVTMGRSGSPLIWPKPGKPSCCFEMRNKVYQIYR